MPIPLETTFTHRIQLRSLACFLLVIALTMGSTDLNANPWTDRTVLTNQHVDLRVIPPTSIEDAPALVVVNSDTGTILLPEKALLVVPEIARLEIPPGLDPLGPAGSSLWILPQGQNSDLLFLGVSVSSQLINSFQSPITIRLKSVTGPGAFIAWQSASFGDLNIRFDSRNGFDDEDSFTALISGHDHINWGFTAPGWYEVSLEIEAVSTSSSELVVSPEFTLLFAVEPLPQEPPDPVQLSIQIIDKSHTVQITLEHTQDGVEYQIWHSPDLESWDVLDTWTATGPSLTVLLPTPASEPARFFQVRPANTAHSLSP